ncbi:MAG: D-alanyl-D-alanine carboxypeptidase/D-alanyl-D-alanine-endopeptidase [Prevotella sp.]|uniref:D-alanyl-D-alanine carboxypeptidase/D-alanyl-D-alanine endopeptidase n=1 Tax=Prevotella sp. TaxID=59823 RepID=UPI0025E3EBA2|nr:D-alanyl-D-alanine carboxypeptidase/D-alanyl-D-alanine-endopeptidase [Prevotella sp.]MBD9299635.1 D-alanyl-D-alanine carboxypeptidase/D-alanyl-D-alanine-endopeptidase [Prevotella sp.]
MNKILRYVMSLLSVMVMSLPLQAQVVIDNTEQETKEEEPADDKDELAVSDSLMVDSLASDSLPWPHAVQVGLDNLLKSKMFETSQVGIMVWDLEADSCIYRFRERQLMRPASTMKLVTAITALDKLGGSYQFKTTLKYTGTVENGVLKGDIYCVGGMDPRFNTDDMTAFVTSLKELGVDSIQGSIYADRSMKDEDLLGEGWCWDDDNPVLSPLVFGRKDLFMDRFLSKLKDAGIFYAGFGASVKRCPQGAFTICTRFHTMDQILHKMMKESDNLYAESMYYQIAASTGNRPASAKSARNVERQLIRKIGLDPARYKLADGSGLSLYNYLSAELEVKLLRYAYRDENMYQQLKQSLPIAGVDGTLKKRMKTGYAHGNVKAKTGTLTGIISLAGYCKAANGHELCFSIINNGIMHGNNARNFADKVCELLCKP